MIETATGLVLRPRPLTATRLIVQWRPPELGRRGPVAKGARRPKSPFQGKLDIFYQADFSFVRSRRSELHTLREVNTRETHPFLRRELGYLQQACYGAALIEQTTETETPLREVYELMQAFLDHLPRGAARPQTVLAFELKLLAELGLQPDLERSSLSPGSRQIIAALTGGDWPLTARLELSAGQLQELRQFLHGFLIYHLGKLPRGREFALEGCSATPSSAGEPHSSPRG